MAEVAAKASSQGRRVLPRSRQMGRFSPCPGQLPLDMEVSFATSPVALDAPLRPPLVLHRDTRLHSGAISEVTRNVAEFHRVFGLMRQALPYAAIEPDLPQLPINLLPQTSSDLPIPTTH